MVFYKPSFAIVLPYVRMIWPFKPLVMNMFLYVPIVLSMIFPLKLPLMNGFVSFPPIFRVFSFNICIFCRNSWPDIRYESPRLSMSAPGWLMASISSFWQPLDQKSVAKTATAWRVCFLNEVRLDDFTMVSFSMGLLWFYMVLSWFYCGFIGMVMG